MVRLFDETAGGAVPAIKRLWASKDEAAASHVSFNQAGDLLVLDGAVYRLDTTSDFRPEREINITFGRSVLQSIDGSGDLIALSRTEHGSQQSIVRVIAWKDKDRFGRPRIVAEWKSNSTVLSIALGSDGRELVCTSKDGAVRIFGRESES
jgi:hypothetical protein